jgi:ferric-dicitrate binding protein FerR (iron transport regulator)
MLESGLDKKSKYEDIDTEMLNKYYNHKCSPREVALIEEWLKDIGNSREQVFDILEDWKRSSLEGDQKELLQSILYKIHYDIHISESKQILKKSKRKKLITIATSVAASVILLIAGFWLGHTPLLENKNIYAELHVPYGSRINFELPDGSNGWLNSGSTLKYPIQFTGKNRTVFLEGEGYFDVEHNPEKPFIVQTGKLQVVALGTSFNVLAYKDADKEISLVKGRVVLKKIDNDNTKKQIFELSPGQHLQIDKQTNEVKNVDIEIEKNIAWKEGKLIFRNDPLSNVIKHVEHFYNVNIEVKDNELFKYHFHATFEDETLFEAIRLLSLSSNIGYEICKREKRSDGTFKERKIILYKKNTN